MRATVAGRSLTLSFTLSLPTLAALGAGLLAALVHPGSASAALSKVNGRCQSGAAKATAQFFAAEAKTLSACRDRIGRGELPLATDCRADSLTTASLATAATKFDDAVHKACGDAAVAALRYAAGCEDVTTVNALAACLKSSQQTATDAFLAGLYSDSTLPSADGAECREAALKEGRKFASKTVLALNKCKNLASGDKKLAGTRCEEDAGFLASRAKLRAKLDSKAGSACDVAALAGAAFGEDCPSPATGTEVGACVQAATEALAAGVAPAEYGDGKLCGDTHNGVEGHIDALLAEMSLNEKIKQMAGSNTLDNPTGWLTPGINRLDLPGFAMIDGPRGVAASSAGPATCFPVAMARGASWDIDLEQRIGEAIGAEARAKGSSVLLAPVTTVVRHPRWGRSQETYGEDPVLLGDLGTAFVRGAQQHVIASLKHYALNSIEDNRYEVSVNVDERTLREVYLPHFRKVVVDGQVGSVMTAYNRVNGEHCAENAHLITDILKGEWGFRGFVESDWINGTRSTAPSALAGLDIEMPAPVYFNTTTLPPLVADNTVPLSVIEGAVRRVLRAKFCFRLDTDPAVPDPAVIESPAHLALAEEAADEGIVLLKNSGAVLPLAAAPTSIAVIGPLADLENIGDNGSSSVLPSSVVTALEGLTARYGAAIVHITGDPNSPANAAAIAAADAAVVVVGFTKNDEGEDFISAGDRDTYALPASQEQLIHDVAALSAATVVVLEGGSSIGIESWVGEVEGLVMAWYPGMQGGSAIAAILSGDVNPSGKLPLVWAKTEADLPTFINDQNDVTYEYYHGYRRLDHNGATPRFPFGFGLSYTTYAYSNLQVDDSTLGEADTLSVTFDVTNSGTEAGEEVAQLYVGYPGTAIDRPVIDLKRFTRVALDPGQTKQVAFEVPVSELAWYDIGLPGWAIEHILYNVQVGSSSRDLPLSANFSVGP